jgi:hypothetical protein
MSPPDPPETPVTLPGGVSVPPDFLKWFLAYIPGGGMSLILIAMLIYGAGWVLPAQYEVQSQQRDQFNSTVKQLIDELRQSREMREKAIIADEKLLEDNNKLILENHKNLEDNQKFIMENQRILNESAKSDKEFRVKLDAILAKLEKP